MTCIRKVTSTCQNVQRRERDNRMWFLRLTSLVLAGTSTANTLNPLLLTQFLLASLFTCTTTFWLLCKKKVSLTACAWHLHNIQTHGIVFSVLMLNYRLADKTANRPLGSFSVLPATAFKIRFRQSKAYNWFFMMKQFTPPAHKQVKGLILKTQ